MANENINDTTNDTTGDSLKEHVLSIIADIEKGITITKDNIEEFDGQYEVGDIMSGLDYLQDVLEIEYRVDSKKEYKSVKLLVAFGGPNIWIDTGENKVIGAWWNEYFEAYYSNDAMDIDSACEEIYNC